MGVSGRGERAANEGVTAFVGEAAAITILAAHMIEETRGRKAGTEGRRRKRGRREYSGGGKGGGTDC